MKKLIAISVVFALVAGVAFAVEVGGTVIGTVNVLESTTADGSTVNGSGGLNRVRIDGSGEAADGTFGGYIRAAEFTGNVWWKPMDQLKLLIGGNGGDGFIGKEGVTGWMFYQTAYDTGIVVPGNVWGWGPWYGLVIGQDSEGDPIFLGNSGSRNMYGQGITTRSVFYAGGKDGGEDLWLFITPADIVSINIVLPFISEKDKEVADIFKKTVAQLDFHLDFGNIALTYQGDLMEGYAQPKLYLYYGGSFDALSIDFGFSYQLANEDSTANPLGVGLGVKYAADAFGVKFRTVATLAGEDKATRLLADVQPYFGLGDNLTAFVSVGLGMTMPDSGDSIMGWHFNPYLQVGEEWGAKFLFGIKVWSAGDLVPDAKGNSYINWAVPIAMIVSF